MSEEEKVDSVEPKKSSKKLSLPIIIVICVGVLAIAVVAFLFLSKPKVEDNANDNSDNVMTYESDIILDDAESMSDKINAMAKQVADGQIGLELKTMASSANGTDFSCYVGNAAENTYDIYLTITLDDTNEEVYRSGLIPPGGRIEKFTTTKELDEGNYMATLTYNQVKDDHQTVYSQALVEYELAVKK